MDLEILEQHKQIYIGATKELIINNTKALIEDDLLLIFTTPPLETMDTIKQRFLSLAKNHQLILDTVQLDKFLTNYRTYLKEQLLNIADLRNKNLIEKLEQFDYNHPELIVKEAKKELVKLDKIIKKEIKGYMVTANETYLLNDLLVLITVEENTDDFKKEITKFLQNTYIKQILETIDIKLLVKDTTLINGLKEQIERFIFTTKNSHLFD